MDKKVEMPPRLSESLLYCLSLDGVYPAVDSSTPLRVTAGGAKDDSGRGSVEMASVAD